MAQVYRVPASPIIPTFAPRTAQLVASGDLREAANVTCWPAQKALEAD